MAEEYRGWCLFDKVVIVTKRQYKWDWEEKQRKEGELQGYIVDPSNKNMLESAIRWGTITERTDQFDEDGKVIYNTTLPEQIEFDNDGFTLQLLDAAEGSSQGGKLSFWNCIVTKDDYRFKVGISSTLLLELLKNSTFVNGVCQHEVFFARCKSGVGMLHKDMDAYKEALADMKKKKDIKSAKKTSKWEPGCNYVTLTEDSMYLCTAYRWLKPMYSRSYYGIEVFIGYEKLTKPERVHITSTTSSLYKNVSSYFNDNRHLYELNKCPSRMRGTLQLDVDIDDEFIENYFFSKAVEALQSQLNHIHDCQKKNWSYNIYSRRDVGLSASSDSYETPEEIKKLIAECGLEYKE